MDARQVFTKEKLKSDWIQDLTDSMAAISESERNSIARDAKSTMMLGIKLYGFDFADELQKIRKEVLNYD